MAVTQYIGARYVQVFADPAEWSNAKEYEPLTVVLHEGNSFTSKQFVPVGIDINNEKYWAETGNYNAQVEAYRREAQHAYELAQGAQNDIDTLLPKADFSAANTVKDYIDASFLKKDSFRLLNIASRYRASCAAIIDANGNAIMFDLSDETNGQNVVNSLLANGVRRIVGVVLSHYDHDHLGDYTTIFTSHAINYDGCVFYIPDAPRSGYVSQTFIETYNAFIAWLNSRGFTYRTPTENETVLINDILITFNNTNSAYWYSSYSIEDFNYNWTSICSYVVLNNIAIQFMGDLYTEGLKYFVDSLRAVRKSDILFAPHHGLTNYVNNDFMNGENPSAVIMNYGTNNDYIATRKYSSAIAGFCRDKNISCFDTVENGTFSIEIVNGNYTCNLIPFIPIDIVTQYPSMNDATANNLVSVSSETNIKTFLDTMNVNSRATFIVYNNYQIFTDLSLRSAYTVLDVYKGVGGATNYLLNRNVEDNYFFTIDIYDISTTSEPQNATITGRKISGVFSYSITSQTAPQYATITGKKAAQSDTAISWTTLVGSRSRTTDISLADNTLYVNVAGKYEISINPTGENVDFDFTIEGLTFHCNNGATATKIVALSRGSHVVSCDTQSTNAVELYVKLLSYTHEYAFPE